MTDDNESLEELFTCKICFNNYDLTNRKPMLLPCQHCICSICLPQLVKYSTGQNRNQSSYIQCPFCSKQYFMNVSDIPKNRIILQFLEVSHGNLKNIQPPPPPPITTPQLSNVTIIPSAPPPPSPSSSQQSYSYYSSRTIPPPIPARPIITSNTNQTSHSQPVQQQWDESDYLRKLFNDVDINGDGTITFNELHSALIRGQPNSQFDIKTAELLVNKYDTNSDGEINFHEFQNLFNYLNEEYFKFLIADTDGSQTIDSEELEDFFKERGYKFKKDFFNYVINTIKNHNRNNFSGITFDYYCRVMARFDYLLKQHSSIKYYKSIPLENYLKETFFSEFW